MQAAEVIELKTGALTAFVIVEQFLSFTFITLVMTREV
jgi:hypothetical protein